MKVLIRTDASIELGTGHVMRCLTLADELRSSGAEIRFVSRGCLGNLISLIRLRGFDVDALPDDTGANDAERQDILATRKVIDCFAPDWLVVDHYGLGIDWEDSLRQVVPELLAIDDLGRSHVCTLLLDQNWFGDATEKRYANNRSCRRLLGPRYSLLSSEYGILRAMLPPCSGVIGRVLVFFGGSDTGNETAKALEALSSEELSELQVDVVLGVNHSDPRGIEAQAQARRRTTLYRNLPSLAGLMVRADLVLGAGGVTTWERATLGLPAIVAPVADNQVEPSLALQARGSQIVLGDVENRPDAATWRSAITSLVSDPNRVRAMSAAAAGLSDGLGVKRVARAMLANSNLGLRLRPAALNDEALLLGWANDKMVRENSFIKHQISALDHARWFRQRLAEPTILFLIGEDRSGLPLGQVRLDINQEQGHGLIDVSVDASLRGLGLGVNLLQEAIAIWERKPPLREVMAKVVDGNSRSIKLFQRCGFVERDPQRPGIRCFIRQLQKG